MEIKLFEVRDSATFMPVMAIRLFIENPIVDPDNELWLLRRAGYSLEQIITKSAEPYIILVKLNGVEAQYDPFNWVPSRTMGNAHRYIIDNWNDLKSGEVIDVEFILGETQVKKRSERYGEAL